MNEKDKELLAQFHHTISEQLDSRLSESPKFFGLLIVVSTGYGYVLSKQELFFNKELFVLSRLLSYAAVLWASWYLAALSYGFRFLQNCQHCAEHALNWNKYGPKGKGGQGSAPGRPPKGTYAIRHVFWLLPSIYHPHAIGLFVFLLVVCGVFYNHVRHWGWSPCFTRSVVVIGIGFGVTFMYWINRLYKVKFDETNRNPNENNSA